MKSNLLEYLKSIQYIAKKIWILCLKDCLLTYLCQTRTADIVDVIYVNIVTWSVGCKRVGEVAKDGQLLANQGQEWMGIHAMGKKAGSPSK
jgi:hypothetical protein